MPIIHACLPNAGPMASLSALIAVSEPKSNRYTTAEWLRVLEVAGVPHPQIRWPSVTDVDQPIAGPLGKFGLPVDFSAKPEVVWSPPAGDEHSPGILPDLDHGPSEIDALIDDGAVAEFARWANTVNP
jgi:crotonobetainyl-CoA:carnitine CoA-transferase CaiB-like acyl-CoA transferase